MADAAAAAELAQRLRAAGSRIEVLAGAAGVVASWRRMPAADVVMAAISGAAGLASTLAAAEAGKRLLLANKESAVMAGPLLIAAVRARRRHADPDRQRAQRDLPVPAAELARRHARRRRAAPAADGLGRSVPRLERGADGAARRPSRPARTRAGTWAAKISVDSATLMNKGLELIEARVLFGMPAADIAVVVHPQSIVHSLVEYADGSTLAQLGSPDMRTPIAQALAWPERIASGVESSIWCEAGRLEFQAPDPLRFPCLGLAAAAARDGRPGAAPG